MELVYAFLATHATVNNGKITVFDGDFDSLQVSSLPGIVPPFAIVVKVRFQAAEIVKPHFFQIRITNPSGRQAPVQPPQQIPCGPNLRDPSLPTTTLVMATIVTGFDEPGEYGVHVYIDDGELVRLPLHVSLGPQPTQPT